MKPYSFRPWVGSRHICIRPNAVTHAEYCKENEIPFFSDPQQGIQRFSSELYNLLSRYLINETIFMMGIHVPGKSVARPGYLVVLSSSRKNIPSFDVH